MHIGYLMFSLMTSGFYLTLKSKW